MKSDSSPNPDLSGRFVWDWFRGEIIDVTTGEVVDRIYVAESPMREDDEGNLHPDANIVTPADPIHPLHLPHPSYILLNDVLSLFVYLKSVVPIPCSTYLLENTVRRYLKALGRRNLADDASMLALIYVALEENNVTVDVYELAEALRLDHQEVKSAIMRVKAMLNKSVSSFEERTRRNIVMYCRRFNLPREVVEHAMATYDRLLERGINRFTPRTLALSIIYISLIQHGMSTKCVTALIRTAKLKRIATYICSQTGVCLQHPSQ